MATTTESILGGVELVNIISVSELRLQRNFELVVKCLQEHSSRLQCIERRQQEHAEQEAVVEQQKQQEVKELLVAHDSLEARVAELSERTSLITKLFEEGTTKAKQSLTLVNEQLRSVNGLADERQTQLCGRLEKLMLEISTAKSTADRLELEAENNRKEAAHTNLKADTSYKKSKLMEQKLELLEERIVKLTADTVSIKESIAAKEQESQSMVVQRKNTKGRASLREACQTLTRTPEVIIQQQLCDSLIDIRRRVQQLEEKSSLESEGAFNKINLELSEVRQAKEQIKRILDKEKLQGSSTIVSEKIEELRPELQRLTSRIDTAQDRYHCLDRKLEEARKAVHEVYTQLKQSDSGKFQQRLRTLQSDLISQLKDLSCRLEDKTGRLQFLKQCDQSKQRYRQLSDLLSTKCDKLEVKKALLFIQAKIKEIILVISEDEENEKQALLTKKNVKCISCDKELDRFTGLVSVEPRNWNVMPTKELQTDSLGKFGITKYGSLTKKLKRLEGNSDLPLLKGRRTTQ